MIRFRFADQDFFEVDPVRYASALGDAGLAAYRKAVAAHDSEDSFAARYARERLAILDGDTDAIVELLGGELNAAHQFVRVAEAMAELGRDEDVLAWTARGIAQTDGWQTAKLYDLACAVHTRRSAPLEVLGLRRAQHERMPSLAAYTGLRAAAEAVDASRQLTEHADRYRQVWVAGLVAIATVRACQDEPRRQHEPNHQYRACR